MFKIISTVAAALIGLLANAQVNEARTVSPFNKLEITDGVEVIYTQEDTFSVKAEASDALGISTLLTESKNQTLTISCNGNGRETVKVYVSAPQLASVKASRNATFTTTGIKSGQFALSLASGASFKGNVHANQTEIKTKSGAVLNLRLEAGSLVARFLNGSKINLSGTAEKAEVRSSGNTLCLARNFKSGKQIVKASGSASVEVCAVNELDVEVTDQASVRYFGFPQKTVINPEAVAQVIHDTGSAVATE